MTRQYLIVFLILIGIFIHPFPSGVLDFIFRFIIFAAVVFVLIYQKQTVPEKENQKSAKIHEKAELESHAFEEDVSFSLDFLFTNDKNLTDYLIKQFQILNGIVFADNGYLFYVDQNNKIKLYHCQTMQQAAPDTYPIPGLLQLVDKKNELLIENNLINKENLVNYNSVPDYNPGSFMGLPVTIHGGKKIYFLFDAREKNHFNPEDRTIIMRIGEGISTFISNRLTAYSLLEKEKEGQVLLAFSKTLNGCATISEAIEVLAVEISKYFEASRLTICSIRSDSGKGVIKKVIGQKDEYVENKEFLLDEGLTGWVISKQKPYLIDDLEKGEYFIPRYSKNEKSNFGLRSFLGVPIVRQKIAYGALTLEHQVPKKYTRQEQTKIEKFIDIFSTLYIRYRKQ